MASYSFLQQATNGTTQTTYTFSSQNLGTAASDRYIVVAVGWRKSGSAPSLSSVSVGGVSATSVVNYKSGTTTATGAAIFIAAVPTGTSGDVVITFSADSASCGIALYRVTGLTDTTPIETATSNANPRAVTLNGVEGGFIIAVDYNNVSGASTTTFSGLTEDYDVDAISNAHHFAGASSSYSDVTLDIDITSTWTTDDASTSSRALAAASFGDTDTLSANPAAGANEPVDGYVDVLDTTWDNAHDATDGDSVSVSAASSAAIQVRQIDASNWYIRRGFLLFDTSSLGSGARIAYASISLFADGTGVSSDDSPAIQIVSSNPASTSNLVVADFDTLGTTVFGSIASGSWNATGSAENKFRLDENGIGNINKSGISKFGIRLSPDTSDSAPSGNNTRFFYWADQTGTSLDPKLTVYYIPGIAATTVSATFTAPAATITGDAIHAATTLAPVFSAIAPTVSGVANISATTLGIVVALFSPMLRYWKSQSKNTTSWSDSNKNTNNWTNQDKLQ